MTARSQLVVAAALIVLLAFSVACDGSALGSPTHSLPSPPPRTFVFAAELSHPVSEYTKYSRYVLFDNGGLFQNGLFRFEFQDAWIYGRYTDTKGVIAFDFGATGSLMGDVLTVQYSEHMQHLGYEDAAYVLMP